MVSYPLASAQIDVYTMIKTLFMNWVESLFRLHLTRIETHTQKEECLTESTVKD